jgi:hypothetical protein
LYGRFDKDDNFQKWGVSQDTGGRYTKGELDGGWLDRYRAGPRGDMLDLERKFVERFPGPLNKEPWAGWKNPNHPNYKGPK